MKVNYMSLKDILTLPEYKITLPSGKAIKYRPFVVKEEKLLLLAKESKDPAQIYDCIKKVVSNCVIEPKDLNLDSLPYFDVQQLFLMLRCKSMGESVQIRVTDPETKQTFDTEMDLEQVVVTDINKKQQKVKLNENVAIQFKYPSFLDFLKITTLSVKKSNKDDKPSNIAQAEAVFNIAALCIDKIYTKEKTIECSTVSHEELVEFIDGLQKPEFNKFYEFFKVLPKLKYRSEFTNPTNGKKFPVEVSDFTNFFIL